MTPLLDLDQLRSFIAIADLGSFTAAADQVGRTQSAISMQMRKLEEQVGRTLFTKEGRRSVLTSDGERLLGYARQMVRLSEETLAAFDETELSGRLRFGLPDEYSDSLLRAILMRFSHTNPQVEVVVTCADSAMLIDLLQKDALDIILLTHDATRGPAEVVRREPLYWVTSSSHTTHTLDPIPLALGWQDCLWRRAAVNTLIDRGRRYRIAYSSWNSNAVGAAVLAGLAVSVLPECALRPGMRVLSEMEGFPRLEPCEIGIIKSWHHASPLIDAMGEDIKRSLNNLVMPAAVA